MNPLYWLVLPNGGRQLIDPSRFDLASVAERARRLGGKLVAEVPGTEVDHRLLWPAPVVRRTFEPPIPALAPLFRHRLDGVHSCRTDFTLDIATRPTTRVLGGYYRRRKLVRVYSHDRQTGRRPLEELFDTFLHEVAHHLEYTEPSSFQGRACQRRRGQMHSPLFWRILSELKKRWERTQRGDGSSASPCPDDGLLEKRAELEQARAAGWLFPMDDPPV
jgi:hypothetical protein